jgi:uncharacterized protein (DUF58 family)
VTSYPFGLFRQQIQIGAPDRFVVYPALGTLNKERLRRWLLHASRPDERHRRARRRLAHEVEFHGRGELMVREFDQGTHCDLMLVVETYDGNGPIELESVLSLAATIAWQWTLACGDRVVLGVCNDKPVVMSSHEGEDGVAGVMRLLSNAEGSSRPDVEAMAHALDHTPLPAGPILYVSGRAEAERSASRLSERLKRSVAFLNGLAPPDFYSPPTVAQA